MLRLVLRAVRRQISTKIRFFKSNETDIVSSRQQMLQQVTKKLNIDIYPSIIEKDEPTKAKRLTNADKMQLGLYIPQSKFNHRLSRHVEKQYLPHITKQLYIQQKENLESYFRILQNNFFLENKRITLDKYVNLIYKDIYSRYLVSKGVGVEWNGFFADKGVMNEYNVGQYDAEEKMFENFSVLLDFIQNQNKSIKRKRTIGMYSHKEQKFIHTDRVEIEKVKKLGYYIKAQFTEFGQFGEQFRMLQQKNGKAYLMVFVQQLEKLINPNAICAIQEDKYIVLKKFINENELEIEYLMVALDCYKQHQKYFKDRDYQKHSTFDGKYLVGMKVMDLPVIPEISEYQRPPNCYIINSNYHIGDFERVNASDIPHLQHFISEQGQLIIDGQQSQIMVNDLKLTKQLQELLIKRGINFMDVYDPFDDQVYYDSQTKNILRFRTGFSYYVDVEGNGSSIFQCLKRQNSIISESKITLPTLNLGKKPRERRRFRKERKQVIEQITEHYSLEQALVEINSISLSSLSQSVYSILFFMKNGRALAYEEVLTEQEMEKMVKNQLSEQTMVRIQNEGIQVEKVYANESLIQALLYLKNVKNSKEILNIIIEPQSETQVLVPYTLHLNYIINKQKKKRRGTSQTKMNINMIKLHPTFEQKTRSLDVKALIEGVVKSNGRQQYGLGFEALRLWVAKNDHLMGDRVITQTDINMQLQHGTHIRRVYWDLLSLMPQKINQNIEPKLYINTFMLDSIDCYITHMQECYKTMNIHKAYELTNDFFFNIVNQIFVKAVRKRIIAYPNHQENQQHFLVIRRILQLLAVISPLFPFSAYHVSKIKMLKWPEIRNLRFYETLLTHNQMIKTRVNIMNKLQLNDLRHAYLYVQTLKEPFSQRDLELFFDVDKVTMKRPDEDSRKCSVNLPKMCVFTEDSKAVFYISEDYCVRCDSKSQQTQHLCSTCVDYLQQQIGQPFKYFTTRSEEKPSPKLDNL